MLTRAHRSPDIAATIAEESTPPLRNAPSGTSLTIWRRTDRATVSATRSRHSLSGQALGRELQVPVLVRRERRRVGPRVVTRRQLADLAERRLRVGHPEEREVVGDRGLVERRPADQRQERAKLRCEGEEAVALRVVERLDAEPVAGEEQPPVAIVPDREGEDPVEPLEHRRPVEREQPQQHLGVAVGREALAALLEIRRAARGSCRSRRCR